MGADLASIIADARCAAGLNQAELARRAGISPSYLSRIEGAAWERGGPWPADNVLRALARALGLSSTELIALRRTARDRQAGPRPTGHPGRVNRRTPYSVSVGVQDVDAAARGVVERNPPRGAMRSVQVFTLEPPAGGAADRHREPSYLDALGTSMAADPDAILYRVFVSDRSHLPMVETTVDRLAGGRPPEEAGNVRARLTSCNPLTLDVLIGEHEVLVAVPDRRGHPHLRAGIVVDDPDFVAEVRAWFDESVWDPPCGYADIRGGSVDAAFAAVEEKGGSLAFDGRGPSAVHQ